MAVVERFGKISDKLVELVSGAVKVSVCIKAGDIVSSGDGQLYKDYSPGQYVVDIRDEERDECASIRFYSRHVRRIDDGRDVGENVEIELRS